MKNRYLLRLYIVLCLCISLSSARAQYVAIPDSNFGNWLNTNGYASCLTGNSVSGWQLDTTCTNILSDTTLICDYSNIHNLKGIGYFKNLKHLSCSGDSLRILPVLPSSITFLDCGSNQLTSIANLPTGLTWFNCSYNKVTSLPNLPSGLNYLGCTANRLTSLPTLPAGLKYLGCGNNQLTSLPYLPSSIIELGCAFNQISYLPNLPSGLMELVCADNMLSRLPSIPSGVTKINCYGNQLTSLPSLPMGLNELYCNDNPSLTCLPYIHKDTLIYFYIANTSIRCIPNRFSAIIYDVNPDTITICTHNSICDTLGTSSNEIVSSPIKMNLFPNPNNGFFTLQAPAYIKEQYTIADMLGYVVAQQAISADRQDIDLSYLAEGVYTLSVYGAEPVRFAVVK
jgi:hypothetical protein